MTNLRIFLDLDEVLVDFVGAAAGLFKVSVEELYDNWTPGEWDMVTSLATIMRYRGQYEDGFREAEFWAMIEAAGCWFWENLEETPWNEELLALVESLTDDWYIATTPSHSPSCAEGKVKYLKRVFGNDFTRFVLITDKSLLANPNAILIDDRESTIRDFNAAGGNGILFPTYHNSLHGYRDDPMDYVRGGLDVLSQLIKETHDEIVRLAESRPKATG